MCFSINVFTEYSDHISTTWINYGYLIPCRIFFFFLHWNKCIMFCCLWPPSEKFWKPSEQEASVLMTANLSIWGRPQMWNSESLLIALWKHRAENPGRAKILMAQFWYRHVISPSFSDSEFSSFKKDNTMLWLYWGCHFQRMLPQQFLKNQSRVKGY